MAGSPLVSVVIPTFNRRDCLGEAVKSILAQTIRDVELIVVDNCSGYDCPGFLAAFGDSRIRAYRNANGGIISVNRNFGIRHARGAFIAFCDDDDTWLPPKLERSLAALQREPESAMVTSNELVMEPDSRLTGSTTHGDIGSDRVFTFEDLFFSNAGSTSAVVLSRRAVDEVGVFDESRELITVEDYHYWLRIAAKYKVLYLNETLGCFRYHAQGESRRKEAQLVNLYNLMLDIWKRLPDAVRPFEGRALSRLRGQMIRIAKHYLLSGRPLQALRWMLDSAGPLDPARRSMVQPPLNGKAA